LLITAQNALSTPGHINTFAIFVLDSSAPTQEDDHVPIDPYAQSNQPVVAGDGGMKARAIYDYQAGKHHIDPHINEGLVSYTRRGFITVGDFDHYS